MHRSRGLYDVGLAAGAAMALRQRGEDPDEWTILEMIDSRGRLVTASLIRRSDASDPATSDAMMAWLNARDPYLTRVG